MPRIKKTLIILSLMLLVFIPTQVSAYQLVILGPDNEVIKYKEGTTVEGDTAFSVLKKSGISFVDEGDKYPQFEGSYITSINNIPISKSQGWIFTVNGKYIPHAASITKIYGDDKVMWCAYVNQENQTTYQWPALSTKKESTNKELITSSKVEPENNEVKIQEPIKEQTQNNQQEQPTKQETFDVNSIIQNIIESNQSSPEVAIQEKEEQFDFRILGYIGFIISFIIVIQFYKLMKGDKNEENKH